ncbi:hypothetical protein O9929_17450 [Vibrio lentus]|nr:hypothetical protein [Vibrio lentus]
MFLSSGTSYSVPSNLRLKSYVTGVTKPVNSFNPITVTFRNGELYDRSQEYTALANAENQTDVFPPSDWLIALIE